MSEDIVKPVGELKAAKDNRGGAGLYPSAVIGIVKNNIDPTKSGRIDVYLKRVNSPDQDNPNSWTPVSYMSPFFGYTPNTGSPKAHGDYLGNPNSYGFWATPPDIGTEVICVFLNGDPNMGYYIGCVPIPGMNHMVPAIGSSDSIIANAGEASSYGGSGKLPVTEINNANPKQKDNAVLTKQPRPVHSYHAATLFKQGLIRDPDRGTIGSSSQRESPSRVFGISTPGRPIYEGGYNNSSIAAAVKDPKTPDKNFKVIGRTGGHTFVMDDGDLVGKDQLMRLRTSAGHMIMMNDAAQTLFIIHANGQSYIELGKEGTIDMYSTNSVNIRTQGDLNLHADSNININAKKDLNISAKNVNVESLEATNQFVGTTFKQHTKGNHTVKVDAGFSVSSTGDASMAAAGMAFINGSKVNLNTGTASLKPEAVKQIPVVAHTDTLGDAKKGYAPAPGKLASIVSRAPAHSPWAGAGQGVDVKVDIGAEASLPAAPAPAVVAANAAAPEAPAEKTSESLAATVPPVDAASKTLDKATTGAVVSQMAVNAATGSATKDAVTSGVGFIKDAAGKVSTAAVGALALTPSQLVESGHIKPGADKAINMALTSGKPLDVAMPSNVFTGKDGIGSLSSFMETTKNQIAPATALLKKGEDQLKSVGLLKGNESPTQTAGLVLATATAGINAVTSFAKSAGGTIDAFKDQAANLFDKAKASVPNLISGGNFAANLSDKTMSPLSGVDVGDKLKGLASGMFSKVTEGYKSFTAGIPQNLTSIKEAAAKAQASVESAFSSSPADAAKSADSTSLMDKIKSGASSAYDSATSAISGATSNLSVASVTGGLKSAGDLAAKANKLLGAKSPLGAVPGGLNAISNVVTTGAKVANMVPGISDITKKMNDITGAASSGMASVKNAIGDAKSALAKVPGLSSLASTGLPKDEAAKLSSAVNSMGGGAVDVKLPTVAEGTFKAADTKALLGNPKIPPLDETASNEPTPSENAARVEALQASSTEVQTAREAWVKVKNEKGASSPDALAAWNEYKTKLASLEKASDTTA